jgi:hypothetical protein
MNILLTRPTGGGQDYLCDSVFHGLRSLFGDTVVDAPRLWYMYKSEFGVGKADLATTVYGRGFTIFATLDDGNIDRTDIERKIANHFFDLIVIARIDHGTPYLSLILEHYKPNQIVILDGKDPWDIHTDFVGKGIYFKREFVQDIAGTFRNTVFPISFAFPREKIQHVSEKKKYFSHVDPRDTSTYIHSTEQSYYNDYRESLFGVTMVKAGWDCMRHYEIMGCRSVPLFLGLFNCPTKICTTLPKNLLLDVLRTVETKTVDWFNTAAGSDYYVNMEYQIHHHFINNCLTDILAKSIIDKYIELRD